VSNRTLLVLLGLFLAIRAITLPSHPLTDDTEARYATVAKDMAYSGDWVTPRIWIYENHIPYLGKPPLHFWVTALSIHLFGPNEFAARLPSLAGAALLIILMFVILRRRVESEIIQSALMILSSSALFFVLAGAVVIDMILTLFITGAVLSYQAFLTERVRLRKKLWSLSVFVFLSLGFLTKGPVAVVMFGIPVFLHTLLHKKWTTLKDHAWLPGILIFLVLTIPWFWLAEIRNPGFLKYFFYNENILRFVTHDFGDLYGKGHVKPYGFALILLLLVGLPWTLWSMALLFRKQGRKWFIHSFKDEHISLITLSLTGITFFLCLTRAVLMTYLLTALPFFAVWCAMLLRKSGIRLKTITLVSVALVVLYGIVYPLLPSPDIHGYSAKNIVQLGRQAKARLSLDGGLVFVTNVPYSAYFYGQDLTLPQPKDSNGLSILKGLDSGKDHLYVVKRKYQRSIPPATLDKLEQICAFGDWTVYRAAQHH